MTVFDFYLRPFFQIFALNATLTENGARSQLTDSAQVTFVYNMREINDWQLSQYAAAEIGFPENTLENLYQAFESLKQLYPNIDLVPLAAIEASPSSRLNFIKKPLRRIRSRLSLK